MATIKLKEREYGIVGRPESGYSMKVLSAMRYKGVAHQWMDRFGHNSLYTPAEGIVAGLTTPVIGKIVGPLLAPFLIKRMVPRMAFAGANDNNKPLLVESFANLVDMLETHLQLRSYLLGVCPPLGDFGLWGQLYQAYIDPSSGCLQYLADTGVTEVSASQTATS